MTNCSSIEKVCPRELYFDYTKHNFFIYVYLDPFQEINKKFHVDDNTSFTFKYRPFYIGKGSTGKGFRHNQHLADYINNREKIKTKDKVNYLEEIKKKMDSNTDLHKPSTPEEYKKMWIVILKSVDTHHELVQLEHNLISSLGRIRDGGNGLLVNVLR
jgi:hypothetical protein